MPVPHKDAKLDERLEYSNEVDRQVTPAYTAALRERVRILEDLFLSDGGSYRAIASKLATVLNGDGASIGCPFV